MGLSLIHILRHDNADARLSEYGYETGLISDERYARYQKKMQNIEEMISYLASVRFTPKSTVNGLLERLGLDVLKEGISAAELLKMCIRDRCILAVYNWKSRISSS